MNFICRFCNEQRVNANSLRNHERLCILNPNRQIVKIEEARVVANNKVLCTFCNNTFSKANIKRHPNACIKNPVVQEKKKKICPVCEKVYYTKSVTCSNSCANTHFRTGIKNPNFKEDSNTAYVSICFYYHKKECIICGEYNIVTVHHFDKNHSNNDPSNLIPLCPTHHQYAHSKFNYLVDKQIIEYRNKFIEAYTINKI